MTLRELIIEYILFAWDEDQLKQQWQISECELPQLSDLDLLELYDQSILKEI